MRKTAERRPRTGPAKERGSFASALAEIIQPETARQLADRFGAAPGRHGEDELERLASVLLDPERVRATVRALPPPALVLLEILCELSGRLLSFVACAEEVDRRLGRSGWGAHALEGLRNVRLLMYPGRDDRAAVEFAFLPAPLADALAPHVADLSLREVVPSAVRVERPGDARPVDLRLAMLVGSFWNDPPRVTASGEVFKTARDKLARVFFPGDEHGLLRFDRLIGLARFAGMLELGMNSLVADRAACAEWTALPHARRAAVRLSVAARYLDDPSRRALGLLCRAAGEGWVLADDLAARICVASRSIGLHDWWGTGERHSAAGMARIAETGLEHLRRLPEVELGRTKDGREVLRLAETLRAAEPAAGKTRAYVQPNFEVLLPPDADFATALGIASIAELRRIEDVATLTLTPAAVRRARDNGFGREEILGALETVAPGRVPQNVAATVADWAGGPRAAKMIDGAVLYCPDPAAAAVARANRGVAALLGPEVAPGLWAVDWFQLNRLDEALRKAGIEHAARPIRVQPGDSYRAPRRSLDELPVDLMPDASTSAPDPGLRGAVAGTRSATPPPPPPSALPPVRARPSPALFRPVPIPDPEVVFDDFEDDEANGGLPVAIPPERRRWVTAPAQGRLRMLLEAIEGFGVELKWLDGRGEESRREVVVERVATRRGQHFVDGFFPDDEEGVSIPLYRITAVAGADKESAYYVDQLLPSQPAAAPSPVPGRPGRNDPCPCGSGRKYKRCCGR